MGDFDMEGGKTHAHVHAGLLAVPLRGTLAIHFLCGAARQPSELAVERGVQRRRSICESEQVLGSERPAWRGRGREWPGRSGQSLLQDQSSTAVDKSRLREKTGYLLMDADFDLDFFGMVAATQLLDRKDITLDHLRKSVFVYVGDPETENGQWAVWECAKLDEGSETEARDKVIQFKERLTAMGKESLFFRWVELIQYESNAPGGFTQERQVAAAEKVKKMFEDEGVDFEVFEREIGGMYDIAGA